MAWKYFGCSVRGSSHIREQLPCQDYSLLTEFPGGELLAIASDGAGSARLSDVGSQLVCTTILEQVTSYLQSGGSVAAIRAEQVDLWFEAVAERLRIQAAAADAEPRDLAATLVAALVDPTGSVFAQLGDGAIVTGTEGSFAPVFWPANGEYANTTFFVTDDNAIANLHVECSSRSVDEVAVFTDGLQMLALRYATKEAHAPFFEPLFQRLRPLLPGEAPALSELLKEYLASELITARTDDDKSLLLATRRAPVSEVTAASEAATPTSAGAVSEGA